VIKHKKYVYTDKLLFLAKYSIAAIIVIVN